MIERITLLNIDKLNVEMYRHVLSHLSDTLDTDISIVRSQILVLLDCPNLYLFVTPSLEEPRGVVTLYIEPKLIHHGACVRHIEDLVVDPEYRGEKIANSLIKHIIEDAKSKGCYKLLLHCSEELKSFYERNGFYSNNKTFGMRMDLL